MTASNPHPSKWLLDNEPDLTPEQVWMVFAQSRPDVPIISRKAVIADTEQQAMDALTKFGFKPMVAINEATLIREIEAANAQPAKVVRGPNGQRFGLVYITPGDAQPVRIAWVIAPDQGKARRSVPFFSKKPFGVMDVQAMTAMQDELEQARSERGNGVTSDGRDFDNRQERWIALESQKIGGRDKFDADVQWIMDRVKEASSTAPSTSPTASLNPDSEPAAH